MKKIKINVLNIFILLLIVINVCYFYWRHSQSKNEFSQQKISKSNIQSYIPQSISIKDRYLKMETWKDSIPLSGIVSKYPILILRIPRVSCQQCKSTELDNLKINFTEYGFQNVCAILTVKTPRDLKSLSLSFDYDFLKVGSKDHNILDIPLEKYNKPYYFILDSNLRANMFFIPDMTKPELTQKYFEMVKDKYFRNI